MSVHLALMIRKPKLSIEPSTHIRLTKGESLRVRCFDSYEPLTTTITWFRWVYIFHSLSRAEMLRMNSPDSVVLKAGQKKNSDNFKRASNLEFSNQNIEFYAFEIQRVIKINEKHTLTC